MIDLTELPKLIDIPTYTFKRMELTPLEAREVCNCFCHMILFHRSLGIVKPMDAMCDTFNVCYAKVDDEDLDKKVYDGIDAFIEATKKKEAEQQFRLSFYHPTTAKSWIGSREIKRDWEYWILPILLIDEKPRTPKVKISERRERQAKLLQENTILLMKYIDNAKYEFPPLKEGSWFPFEIILKKKEDVVSSFTSSVKDFLKNGPPMLIR